METDADKSNDDMTCPLTAKRRFRLYGSMKNANKYENGR